MILSDREIAAALDNKFIEINPEPDKSLWTSTAIDLTLDSVVLEWTPKDPPTGEKIKIRPAGPNFSISEIMNDQRYGNKVGIDPAHGYELHPHSFILAYTEQRIKLPHRSRLAARVEGKSSLARFGVGVHVTAPTIHAGFGFDAQEPSKPGQPIQLEIFNLGNWLIVLDTGMPICQLILEEVREVPIKGYNGRFKDQSGFQIG